MEVKNNIDIRQIQFPVWSDSLSISKDINHNFEAIDKYLNEVQNDIIALKSDKEVQPVIDAAEEIKVITQAIEDYLMLKVNNHNIVAYHVEALETVNDNVDINTNKVQFNICIKPFSKGE